MELFAALLTGILSGGFFLYLHVGRFSRSRQQAGTLLYQSLARFWMSRSRYYLILFVIFLLPSLLSISTPFFVFINTFGSCCLAIFFWTASRGPELREQGILLPFNGLSLIPWDQVWYCKWLVDRHTLLVMTGLKTEKLKIMPEHADQVSEILVQRVRLFDANNNALNPDFDPPKPASSETVQPIRVPFQFDLRTLLLLMVVASAASAWLGIHLRTQWREQAVLEKLAQFNPSVTKRNNRVYTLCFTQSKSGPTDNDLQPLAVFGKLQVLNLSNTPITDNGVIYLIRLHGLKALHLKNTQITDEGIRRLQEALPETMIYR